MSFFNLLKKRRSIRRFLSKTVDEALVSQLCAAALLAPSSKNKRSFEFVVVNDKSLLQGLSKARPSGSHFLMETPLAIVVLGDKNITDIWYEDASIAATILQLQAENLGLGSCWIQIHNRTTENNISAETYVKELLKVPENFGTLCVIALGYKAEEKRAYEESELHFEKIHYNQF